MVMPNYFPASALAPQTAGYIASDSPLRHFAAGRQQRQEDEQRNLLREVGGQAASGNIAGATQAAFRGGNIRAGMDISNWNTDRRVKAIDMLHQGAQRADTPEKWNALVSTVERTFGPDMVGEYRDFNARPSALTALERATLELRQAQARTATMQAQTATEQARFRQHMFDTLAPPSARTVQTIPIGPGVQSMSAPAPAAAAPPMLAPPGPTASRPVPAGPPVAAPPDAPAPTGVPGVSFGAAPAGGDPEMLAPGAGVGAAAAQAQPSSGIAAVIGGMDDRTRAALAFALGTGDDKTVARLLAGPKPTATTIDDAAAKARGKALGEAQAALPQALQSGQSMLENINAVAGDPNLPWVTGWQANWSDGSALNPLTHLGNIPAAVANIPNIGSGPALNTTRERIAQIQGQAFLQAFQSLKGAGQITEQEGAKAQAAMTRLNNLAQDDAGYVQALNDARKEIQDLMNLARVKAGQPPVSHQPSGSGGDDSTVPPPGTRLRFNPATGNIE